MNQRVLIGIEPAAHDLVLVKGTPVALKSVDELARIGVFVDDTRIGVIPDGIDIDLSRWDGRVAAIGDHYVFQGERYLVVTVELIRR